MEKKNYLLIVLVAILFLIIGGVGTYVIINNNNDKEPIVDNNEVENKPDETEIFTNDYIPGEGSIKKLYIENYLVPNGYTILLKNDELSIQFNSENLINKYGKDYKIANNVSNFYLIDVGQGGGRNLYFIYNDGTVGVAGIEYQINSNEEISITAKLEYKNIVEIISWVYRADDDPSGAMGPAFIDSNGKIHF